MGFTRNYAFLKYCECVEPRGSFGVYGKERIKNFSGTLVPPAQASGNERYYIYPVAISGAMTLDGIFGVDCINRSLTVKVGSSNTEETFDDYTISEIENVSAAFASRTVSLDENIIKSKFVINITNQSGSSQTIKEIGIVMDFRCHRSENDTGSNFSASYSGMVYRKKLDTPITIPSNGNSSINLEICHEY